MQKLLFDTLDLQPTDHLYLLGDYIDRGTDSKGVLDTIRTLLDEGYQLQCLRGNHEQLLLQAVSVPDSAALWLRNGGIQTLESFGVSEAAQLPHEYVSLMSKMPYYVVLPDYYLVHAGFNFAHHNTSFLHDTTAMLWIRDWYHHIDDALLHGRRIIHGHTPLPRPQMEAQMSQTQQPNLPINIDAGCVYVGKQGLGCLCALDLSTGEAYFEPNCEHLL